MADKGNTGAENGLQINTAVLHEFFVFGSDVAVLYVMGNFIYFYIFIRTAVDFSYLLSVGIINYCIGKHMETILIQIG